MSKRVLSVLGIAAAVARSGLLFRLGLVLARRIPSGLPGQAAVLLFSGVLLSPLIPQTQGRTGLTMPLAFVVSGATFLSHEQHGWLYGRAPLIHHVCGWTLIVGAIFPLAQIFRPRSLLLGTAFALTFLVVSIALFSSRDRAPIFSHLFS